MATSLVHEISESFMWIIPRPRKPHSVNSYNESIFLYDSQPFLRNNPTPLRNEHHEK